MKDDHCHIDIVMTLKNCQNNAITPGWFGDIFLSIKKEIYHFFSFFLESHEG